MFSFFMLSFVIFLQITNTLIGVVEYSIIFYKSCAWSAFIVNNENDCFAIYFSKLYELKLKKTFKGRKLSVLRVFNYPELV